MSVPSRPSPSPAPVQRIGLSTGTWIALVLAFVVLVALLALTAVTLISQRQRTVELNRQLGALVGEATYVLNHAKPALNAVPGQAGTIKSRAAAASDLVSQARPLVDALRETDLPDTVNSAGQLIAALSANGLPRTVGAAGQLIGALDRPNGLSATLADLDGLLRQVSAEQLVPRASTAIDAVLQLLHTQERTLHVQEQTLATAQSTRGLTARTLGTAQATLLTTQQALRVAEQTLAHAESIDRKVGPVP